MGSMRRSLVGPSNGTLAEYVVLSEDAVVHIPEHLSFEEAATLPCPAVTAWNALVGGRELQAGDIVLTLGGWRVPVRSAAGKAPPPSFFPNTNGQGSGWPIPCPASSNAASLRN